MLNSGVVYARVAGSATPMQSIGGIEELKIDIKDKKLKQPEMSKGGGGNRAIVSRVEEITFNAKLQDINAINLSRAVFGSTSLVAANTVVNEAVTAYRGGLIRLAHIQPTALVLKKGAAIIDAAGNFEVRPEGIFVFDDAIDIMDETPLMVDYSHSGYDLIEALAAAAPTLEMSYAGVNEADSGNPCTVDLFRVKLGAAKSLGLINKDFGTLDIDGEVMADPTKVGAGISRFFRVQMV